MQRPGQPATGYLALFVSLYALQGVVVAYFFNFNQLYMMAGGVPSAPAADAQSLALLPFLLKFLAGPLSDRVSPFGLGHRKPYILLGLVVQSAGLVGLSLVPPGRWPGAFTLVALLTVTGLALYDTCCDGLVIDVTPPQGRDRVQAWLVASRAAAAMLGTLGFGQLLEATGNGPGRGWPVLWICAGLGTIPLALALALPEPDRAEDADRFHWRAFRVLIRPRSLVLLAFGAFYALVGYGVEINLSPFYSQELGLRERTIGNLGTARYVGRVLGAALLPMASRRLGRGWVLRIGLLALALSSAAQATVMGGAEAGLAAGLFGAANGWTDAIFYVLAMESSDRRMAASTYALFMAVTNVSVLGGAILSRLATGLGTSEAPAYRPAFLIAGALVLLAWTSIRPLSAAPPDAGDRT
jgi:PAT family beta-lactamase induction signal transducer AmpG